MIDREHPCARGLTPNCFKAYPEWAKQAFAYRLMHTLFPGQITRRLPRVLWAPLIGEEAEIPPDVVLPPGTVVPPYSSWDLQWTPWFFLDFDWWVDPTDLFPPDWETGDPLPPGVGVDPEYVFPPGWTPDLPLPPGVDVDPGVTFPPGWTPDLPLPPGVTIDPIQVLPPGWNPGAGGPPPIMLRSNLPPEAIESGPAPPAYTQIWEPGPVHRPAAPLPVPEVPPWFYEPFDADLGVFTAYVAGGGVAVWEAGRAKLTIPADSGYAALYYEFTENWPVDYDLSFKLEVVSGSYLVHIEIYTGTHRLYFSFYAPTEVYVMRESDNWYLDGVSYEDLEINWKLVVTGDYGDFYRALGLLVAALNLRNDTSTPPYIWIQITPWGAPEADTIVYVDEFLIVEP